MKRVAPEREALPQLDPVEIGIIEGFVQFSRQLGQPRSYAEIYGLLFISHVPLSMDALVERLNLSKGSASQGLKFLEDIGAVRAVYIAGERRTHYEAVAELRNLVERFLNQQIVKHLEHSEVWAERLGEQAQTLTGERRKHVNARIKLLRSWTRNAHRIVSLFSKLVRI
jgi:DNA-binding transcriptional regulator GbsR (MarR family)